jgi:hypothetical protein
MLTITVSSYALEYNKTHLRKVMRQAGKEIAATAKGLLSNAGTGRKYGSHISSAPGQPPSSKSGRLANSFTTALARGGEAVRISDLSPYSKSLEGGAQGGGGKNSASVGRSHKRGGAKGKPMTIRMLAPRPFLSTAVKADWPDIEKRIQDSVAQDINLTKKK